METVIVKKLSLEGLCCPNCAAKIERGICALPGINAAAMDFANQRITLKLAGGADARIVVEEASNIARNIEPDIIVSEITGGAAASTGAVEARAEWPRRVLVGTGTALFAAGLILNLPSWAKLAVFIASYLMIGGEVLLRAAKNIMRGEVFDENFLMSLATIGAFAVGEYPEGVAVMLFYQIGEAFQQYAVGRSRRSIAQLMDIRPDYANLKVGEEVRRVSPDEVGVGDTIIVKPGERVPLDGAIIKGRSALDMSALTGESLPRDVEPGNEVLSGSICKNGVLTVRVTKEFGDSTASKILDLVQNAASAKAPVENFITRFSRYYTPAVVFAAAALAIIPPLVIPGAAFADWLRRALVFLVVSCPCALVISIPLSFFGGIGGASRSGILVKGSNYLDALTGVDTVVFDKTGTLTKGVFAVSDIVPVGGMSSGEVLELAACAEAGSNHPIAASIRKAYGKPIPDGLVGEHEETAGQGTRVRVNGRVILAGSSKLMETEGIEHTGVSALGTVVHIAVDGKYAGHIIISDEIKPDSKQAIARLRAAGVKKTVMLTGDAKAVGESVARELGLDEVYSELLPGQKVEMVEQLIHARSGAGKLAFVGDGINDAPVLARADVGIAMGGVGSDAAIEAADIVLMTDEPSKVSEAIGIAKKTRAIVTQNIVFALGVKAVILALGAAGMANMWEAVFGDVGVALIAVLNSMRAMKAARQ